MNIQRLKFAYARGARIQCSWEDSDWYLVAYPEWRNAHTVFRIHPDDAHLEYGPLSSELRRRAIEGDFSEVQIDYFDGVAKYPLWEGLWAHFVFGDEIRWARSELTRMHFLFVAEMLADEGL